MIPARVEIDYEKYKKCQLSCHKINIVDGTASIIVGCSTCNDFLFSIQKVQFEEGVDEKYWRSSNN